MEKQQHVHSSDWHGVSRLMLNAVDGVIDIVESTHANIARMWGIPPLSPNNPVAVIDRAVYRSIRAIVAMTGNALDAIVPRVASMFGTTLPDQASSAEREAVLAAANGLIGDYLKASGNPLAIPMRFRMNGLPLHLQRGALEAEIPGATGKLLVLIHGLCRNDLQWRRRGHDHGATLARELGYTPVYLHYNTGLHVSANGAELAAMMEELVSNWPCPLEEVTVVAYSMGGLVARSALHYAKQSGRAWPRRLQNLVFLGTPHHGAPLERGGNWLHMLLGSNPFTMPLAHLGRLRSAGITDLRHGNLLDEDWHGHDRFEQDEDVRKPVPLPREVKCYAIAGTTGRRAGDIRDRILGDGLVPLDSALGRHADARRNLAIPKSRQCVVYGVHHLDLLSRAEVYAQLRRWLGGF